MRELLHYVASELADYRESLPDARVYPETTFDELRAALGGPLGDGPEPAADVAAALVKNVTRGLVASDGPRFFGFVVGGSVDAALAADLLAVGWDQLAFNHVSSPVAAVVEEVAGSWLKNVLSIPASASIGFVTGGQGANTVCLAAARHRVLANAGWDVEQDGLVAAPPVRVVASVERHATIDRSLRLLGLGRACVEAVPADANGAIDVDRLRDVLAEGDAAPTIVCAQAGNVNTGACDDLAVVCEVAHGIDAWVHVDGAFGLWAAASPSTRQLVNGIELADSWACDGHKWLNVTYDCGYALCAHPDDHAASMNYSASYLAGQGEGAVRNPSDFNLESSRRARGFATWAALRQLGRSGVADLVDRCNVLARRFAQQLDASDGCVVVNDVVLNQVLVRVADDAETTDRIIDAVQRDGTCWLAGTTWRGERLVRISVSNHTTTEADVDRSVAAIRRARAAAG
ncbi:MAG: aminotransferase class V-fold PLP-dependent enzyme [Ilumatobacteraceae bacterium]